MRKIFTGIFGWITGARDWLTLLAVAGVAAWLYAQYATVARDRGQLQALATEACAAAGSQLLPSGGKLQVDGKVRAARRGEECLIEIRAIAAFKRETDAESAQLLGEALQDHNRKTEADAALARRSADRAQAAAAKMEGVDAAIQNDRVGADWFGAVNDVAGLRRSPR